MAVEALKCECGHYMEAHSRHGIPPNNYPNTQCKHCTCNGFYWWLRGGESNKCLDDLDVIISGLNAIIGDERPRILELGNDLGLATWERVLTRLREGASVTQIVTMTGCTQQEVLAIALRYSWR